MLWQHVKDVDGFPFRSPSRGAALSWGSAPGGSPTSAPEAAARSVPHAVVRGTSRVGEGEANAAEPAQHTGGGTRALPGLPGPGNLRPAGQLVLKGPRATRAAQQRGDAPLQESIRYGDHEIARVVQAHAGDERRYAHV